jgi:D-lactate dehydrogenase
VVSGFTKDRSQVYHNVDGHRVDDGRYHGLQQEVLSLPSGKLAYQTCTFAYGTDASFYRLNRRWSRCTAGAEMQKRFCHSLLPAPGAHHVRATGTSLSARL